MNSSNVTLHEAPWYTRAARKVLAPWLFGLTSQELVCSSVSFSQFGEDLLVKKLLSGVECGTYVDVGCYDPIYLSNTYLFYKLGWRGLLIDANPETIPRLQQMRPRDTVCHFAVGTKTEDVSVVTFDAGMFATLKSNLSLVPEDFRANPRSYNVQQRPLAVLLREANLDQIDFMDIDCEGSDLDVLASNDWSKYRPSVIAVEDHSRGTDVSDTHRFMVKQGYVLRARALITSIFARGDL